MKILNICAYTWEIGGPARIIYDHTVEVLKQGHQVDILSPCSPGDETYTVPEGARVITCLRTPIISKVYREFSTEMHAYLKAHIHEYDIIHIHGIWHYGSLAPFLINKKVPKVITIHGLLDRWALKHSGWKKSIVSALWQKRLLKETNLIHINNTDEEEDVKQYLGYSPDNLTIIPNGMKMEEYVHLPEKGTFRKAYGIPADKKILLFMGRLNIKKGLDLLLPAFKKYLEKYTDVQLVLAGPDDGYEAEARKFVEQNQLEHATTFVGMLTGTIKKAALSDADVFVLPTYSEGFSIAVLEAMASRLAVVVSNRTGFDDYTQQYQAASVTELNVESLVSNLEKTLNDTTYRNQIADNAYRMLEENFDIRIVANKMLDAYKATIAQSKK